MLWGQACAIGFLLFAPLGWFFCRDARLRTWWFDCILPLGMGLLAGSLLFAFYDRGWEFERIRNWVQSGTNGRIEITPAQMAKYVVFGLPALLCYIFVERPMRFGLAVGAFVLAYGMYDLRPSNLIHQERSYFGVLKINEYSNGHVYHTLTHGTTTHGMQYLTEDRRAEPLTYYHHNGPVGQMFNTYPELTHNFAVIGLGTGTMAAYGDRDHKVTYYEIDRHVRDIARNPKYFTYLSDYATRRGEEAEIVMGDARLQFEKVNRLRFEKPNPPEKYGIVIVDAFSSDAIPVHLITREAVQILFEGTAENGIVAYHISNRWLDLKPVLYHIAKDLGLAALVKHDGGDGLKDASEWYSSEWVVLARKPEYLEKLQRLDWLNSDARKACLELSAWPGSSVSALATAIAGANEKPVWEPLELPEDPEKRATWEKVGIWTDDFSNIISVFDWRS